MLCLAEWHLSRNLSFRVLGSTYLGRLVIFSGLAEDRRHLHVVKIGSFVENWHVLLVRSIFGDRQWMKPLFWAHACLSPWSSVTFVVFFRNRSESTVSPASGSYCSLRLEKVLLWESLLFEGSRDIPRASLGDFTHVVYYQILLISCQRLAVGSLLRYWLSRRIFAVLSWRPKRRISILTEFLPICRCISVGLWAMRSSCRRNGGSQLPLLVSKRFSRIHLFLHTNYSY